MSIKVKILGSGREVGRAGILIKSKTDTILCDYGVDISGEEPKFPLHVKPREIDFICLTHAHLDHSGGIPLLYVNERKPLITTSLTWELAELLIKDFLKISKYYVPYEIIELEETRNNVIEGEYGSRFKLKGSNVTVKLYNSGHIPGSSLFMLELDGFKILYTGDFNIEDSCLLNGADLKPFKEADILIMEATYSKYDHPPREENELLFIDTIREVNDNGGVVLIPSFAVGRAQEILCVLAKYDLDIPIYLDGMAKAVIDIMLRNRGYLGNDKLFKKAVGRVKRVNSWKMRRRIVKEPCIIVSPAGMLKGGASVFYMEKIAENPKNAVIFVSYQIEDTPGRNLLSNGYFMSPRGTYDVNARVEWFDFSSHCGHSDLLEILKKIKTDTKVIIVHSDEHDGLEFVNELRDKFNVDVYFPKNGAILEF